MKRVLLLFALASAMVLAVSNTALAANTGQVRVSHGDPFANCALGGDGFAKNYRSAEVEPWIADNPAHTANVIGTWQQDRWSDGGAKGQVAGWSFDGGRTWGQTPQPFTLCAQPFYSTPVLNYQRTSDPWVSIGPDGTAYAISLPFDGDFVRNGMGVAVSHDGGRTWTHQQDIDPLVANPNTLDPGDDKESVTADPRLTGYAYAVWDQLQDIFPPCPAPPARQAAVRLSHDAHSQAKRAAVLAPTGATPCPGLFTGPSFFSRTTDGGLTWEKPRLIVLTGVNEQTIGNQIVIDRGTGRLYDFFNFIQPSGTTTIDNIEMVFSTDQGVSWSPKQYVQRLMTTAERRTATCACGVVFPGDETKPLRTGDVIPEVAIDPNSGQLYVIWQDGRPNGFKNDMLFASTSTAGGLPGTWSAPELVNPPDDKSAFTAAIAVNARGQVGITYYDLTPPITTTDVLLTETWFAATDGPGLEFGPRHLVGSAFNMEAAPIARGWFVGDYIGLTARVPALETGNGDQQQAGQHGGDQGGDAQGSDGGFVPIFVSTNCTDNSCQAVGTLDGSPAGPDSTDVFSNVHLSPSG